MNAVLVLTLVCALAYVTSAEKLNCALVLCAACADNEESVWPRGQCCPQCTPRKKKKVCPEVTGPSMCPEAELCSDDSDCQGSELCCPNDCGNVCMKFVWSDLSTFSCIYQGTKYNEGDSFPAVDGCNTCACSSNGLVACTLLACIPAK